jgi:hypothetical protein
VARLDDLGVEGKKERAEEARRKLREAGEILSAPAGSPETRAAAILQVLHDLQQAEQGLPGSRAVKELLFRARQEAAGLRDRMWKDGRQLMGGRSVGQTLGRRSKRAEEGVRLLATAKELDQDDLPALADDLSKAQYRLTYLQTAQRKAKAARRRRLPVYAFLGLVAVGALFLAGVVLDLVPFPVRRAPITPTVAPAPGETASPAVAQAARSPTAMPGDVASPTVAPAARSPTATPGDTASPPPPPATPSPTATPGDTATTAPSPTPQPTATPWPSATPTPPPTATPTAGPRRATPAPSPTASAPPTPALAPGAVYPAPQLLQPEDVVFFSRGAGSEYVMRWQWAGTLRADEWFDVRVWQEGTPHHGVAWTKQPEYVYDLCLKGSGYFLWSVAVVRGREGQWLADLSPEATPRRFSSSRDDRWCARNGRLLPGIAP